MFYNYLSSALDCHISSLHTGSEKRTQFDTFLGATQKKKILFIFEILWRSDAGCHVFGAISECAPNELAWRGPVSMPTASGAGLARPCLTGKGTIFRRTLLIWLMIIVPERWWCWCEEHFCLFFIKYFWLCLFNMTRCNDGTDSRLM